MTKNLECMFLRLAEETDRGPAKHMRKYVEKATDCALCERFIWRS